MLHTQVLFASSLTRTEPAASAWIQGNADHPSLSGTVLFYPAPMDGVLVSAEIRGLPMIHPSTTGFITNRAVLLNRPVIAVNIHF